MLVPQDIYDLDTLTLEDKTQQLRTYIRSMGGVLACPKSLVNVLQLAELQIKQRLEIQQFGFNLDMELNVFQEKCLYPEPVVSTVSLGKPKILQKIKGETRHVTKEQKKVRQNIVDIIKATKLDEVFTSGPSTMQKQLKHKALTVVNTPGKSVPKLNTRVSTQSQLQPIRNVKPKFQQSVKTLKAEPIRKSLIQTKSMANTKELKAKSYSSVRTTISTLPITRQSIVSDLKLVDSQRSEAKQETPKSPQPVHKTNREPAPQPKKQTNTLPYLENDVYSEDQEHAGQQDYTPLLEIAERQQAQLQLKQEEQPRSPQIQPQEIQSPPPAEPITDAANEFQTIRLDTPQEVHDKFDYFRLTVSKKNRFLSEADSSGAQPTVSTKPAEQSNQLITDVTSSSKQLCRQQVTTPDQDIERNKTTTTSLPEQPVPTPKVDQKPLKAAVITSRSIHRRPPQPQKKTPTQKILQAIPRQIQLPPYHQYIPNFQSLFHPQADMHSLLRELSEILRVHLGTVDVAHSFKPNLYRNIRQFDTYVNGNSDKIKIFGERVDLNLQEFQRKDEIARMRADGVVEMPAPQDVLFYRVIKTKQQVYDIISSTFNRTRNWAQLPHGMNLKSSWNLLWTWAKPQIDFKKLFYFQKVNHFPHNKHLSRKDMLKKNIDKLKRLGPKAHTLFDVMPQSYLLPGENSQFVARFLQEGQTLGTRNLWILKPVGQSRGRGISLVNSLANIEYSEPVVLQKYLQNPLLLDGYKFDMRIYVLVTSMAPLEVFLYRQGFARLSTQKFTLSTEDLSNNYIHLTNFAIQKENFTSQGFSFGGTKLSLKMLRQRLARMGISWNNIWSQVIEVVLKSCVACANEIPPNNNCFELFGYDIIIDSNLKCWLLEVNSSPSLQREFLLDEIVKQQLIDDTIAVVDPIPFDRSRLLEVLERRALENEGRKSLINTNNNTTAQLDRDIHYILHGRVPRRPGQKQGLPKNYEMIAPSDKLDWLLKVVSSYKVKKPL